MIILNTIIFTIYALVSLYVYFIKLTQPIIVKKITNKNQKLLTKFLIKNNLDLLTIEKLVIIYCLLFGLIFYLHNTFNINSYNNYFYLTLLALPILYQINLINKNKKITIENLLVFELITIGYNQQMDLKKIINAIITNSKNNHLKKTLRTFYNKFSIQPTHIDTWSILTNNLCANTIQIPTKNKHILSDDFLYKNLKTKIKQQQQILLNKTEKKGELINSCSFLLFIPCIAIFAILVLSPHYLEIKKQSPTFKQKDKNEN